jgi:tetratricopeptide (TPR) repeat protein
VLWTIPGSVWHTEFLPSRPILAVPNEANAIQFIDVTTGAQATGFPVLKGHNAPIRGIAFDADGKKMVSGDEDGHAFVWNTANGNAIPLPDQKESIRSVAFSPDGKWVATSTPADGRIDVWDPNTAGLVHEFKLSTVGFRLWFSPDSAFLLADEQNGRLDLINLKTGNSDKTLVGHNGPVFDMGFSPDRQRVISVGGDGTVRVWDARSGTEILLLDDDKAYTGAAFSPDGMRLATLAGSRLRLWDAALLSADNHKEDWMFYGERGRYYELGEDWALAIADYKQAMQLRAEDPMIRAHLAYCYGAVNDFENAGSESRAVSDSSSTEAKIAAGELSESVLLAAPNFDAKKYNEVAEQVTHLAQNDYDPSNANIAAWICSLVPGTTGKPEDLVDLMRRATNDQPKEYAYQSTLGSILYRAGHYEEAIKTLKSAMSMRPVPSENAPNSVPDQNNSQHDRDGSAFDWIFLAMANERLGQSTEAKKWSKQVADQLDRLKQDPLFDDPNWSWDWEQILQLKTLYAEARSLIEKVSGPG